MIVKVFNLKWFFASFALDHVLIQKSDDYWARISKAFYALAHFTAIHIGRFQAKSTEEVSTLGIGALQGSIYDF